MSMAEDISVPPFTFPASDLESLFLKEAMIPFIGELNVEVH